MSIPAELRGQPEAFAPVALQFTDAIEYAPTDIIADGLECIAAGQNADRIAVRLIRPLCTADGSPILSRGEQRRAILAGVFARNDLQNAAELVAELNARPADDPRDTLNIEGARGGWHAYLHAQRVGAPITGRLLPGNLGTVRTEGVKAYATLVTDIDPEPGADPGVAVAVARDLAQVLVEIGVPRGAILLMQSGRGAYALIAIEPQPLTVRSVMQLATRTVARMIAAAGEPTHGDEAVFDPPRVMRIPGTVNHKPDADPTTPAWILEPWTPGIRTPWSIIEKIAAKRRPKLRAVPTGQARRPGVVVPRRPLRELFVTRGWFYGDRSDGIADVRCPNADQHTDGRDAAILYPPSEPGGPGWLKCSHAHCSTLTLFDVYRLLERGA